MSFQLILTSQAQEQLWQISQWYAETSQSSHIGFAWYQGFHDALRSLTEDPKRCSLAHESEQFPFEVRELLYGSGKRITHRALFRVSEDRIEVLAVRHHAQKEITPEDIELP